MARPSKIDTSPHREVVIQWLREHLSLSEVQRRCRENFAFELSLNTLSRYRDKLMPGQMLPANFIQDKMQQIEYLTDELSRFSILIIKQEERFVKLMRMENEAIELGVTLYAQQTDVSGETSEVARDYLDMLMKFIETKQSLGLLDVQPQKLDIRGMILSGSIDDTEIPEEIKKLTDNELLDELNKEVIVIEGDQPV